MNFLEEKIIEDGVIKKGNILKVDKCGTGDRSVSCGKASSCS